ncbi:hypothetical protein [Dermatobacter hominis]|uniref:hypothetical protein n=1 Tax=Dermatobacter hominis TaxID=2884263 RepID=UPI001D1059E4|nr:hypothetical protein [Dermatobacter hominis]UDY36755.1 hypothetical protein LH044_04255 [Dermatobacter hominis]
MGHAIAPAPRPGDTASPPAAGDGWSSTDDDRRVRPRHLLLVAGIGFLLAVVLLRPWPLDAPVLYQGDVFQHLAIVEATDATGTPRTSDDLAAPAEVDWSVFPTGTERLQLVVLRTLDAATGDVATALNLYLLLGVTATAAVAFAVLRWMGLRPLLAGAVALPFSVGPAFSAALVGGHVFLFALFPVALGTYLALWSTMTSGADVRRRPAVAVWPAVAVVVTALSSAYYTSFTVVVIGAVGLAVAVRARRPGRLVLPAVTAAGLALVAGLSLLPDLLSRSGDPAASALRRTAADVWRYSLHPQDLLVVDEGHPLAPVMGWARSLASDNVTAASGTVLGLVALAGCVGVVVVALRHGRSPRDRADRVIARLATVVVTVLAVAVVGGVGTWLAEVGVTQIRAWSRMTVFLSFAGLAGVALVAQRALERADWDRRRTTAVVVACAALVLLDQGLVPADGAAAEARARSDEHMVAAMAGQFGPDAQVFEVPVVSFPDDPGSGRLLAPAVQTVNTLRFSGGFFRGGAQDWQLSWCRRPTGQFVRAVAAAGFDALLVQVDHHLVRDRDEVALQLAATLGPLAGTSDDGAFAWYDLRPLRAELVEDFGQPAVDRAGALVRRPIGVDYSGVTELRLKGRVMDGGGDVVLRRLDDDTAPVELTMQVAAGGGASERVVDTVDLDRATTSVAVPGGAPVTVSGVSAIDERALTDPVLGSGDGAALPAVCM